MSASRGYQGLAETVKAVVGVELSRGQLQAFRWYSVELQRWNERHNLTAITEPVEVEIKHFVDSLTCLKLIEGAGRLIDVGAGAGFPGIPIKIILPDVEITLLEATRKKVDFCRHVVEGLGLEKISALHGRAEDYGHENDQRARYDWAVGRAVAQMNVLAEYLLPFVRVGGKMIAMKGETGPAEAHAAEGAFRLLGGELRRLRAIELPQVTETRYLVEVVKVSATPDDYPRRAGMPAKRPLTGAESG
ncbi:MAG: 16S rRNA (guanine(527)-N(7))-methyltransferase RsmG [Anaerolineales bacterium]